MKYNSDTPLVYIEWVDSNHVEGWVDPEDAIELNDDQGKCVSIGWILEESETKITIAAHLSLTPNNNLNKASEPFGIPKCSITKMQTVKWV